MKFFSTVWIFILFNFFGISVFSQENDIPEIFPPSPSAYSLGKYGSTPVGYFTGTPQASIPIYNFKSGELSVPISLDYASNGIKVDQLTTNIGLGWNMKAGGVVTRIIKGDADDRHTPGYVPPGSLSDLDDPLNNKLLFGANLVGNPDLNRDEYLFSFPGYSGKFVIAHDGRVLQMHPQDIKIIPIGIDGTNGFEITTSKGIKYIFSSEEVTKKFDDSGPTHHEIIEKTAWYLDQIVHPLGDTISFKYSQPIGQGYIASNQDVLRVREIANDGGCGADGGGCPETSYNSNTNIVTNEIRLLEEISGKTGSILFSHSTIADAPVKLLSQIRVLNSKSKEIDKINLFHYVTSTKRPFLTKVQFKDPDKNYSLNYVKVDQMPERLDRGQDMLGYYNGKSNGHLIPYIGEFYGTMPTGFNSPSDYADRSIDPEKSSIGLLEKITYPTKGYTSFEYEPHSSWGMTEGFVKHEISVEINENTGTIVTKPFSAGAMDISHPAKLYGEITQYQSCGNSPHLDQVNINLYDTSNSETFSIKLSGNSGNTNYGFRDSRDIYLNSGASFSLEIVGNMPNYCYDAIAKLIYYTSENTPGEVLLGGMRIKTIKDYEPSTGQTNTRRFYYNKKENYSQSKATQRKDNVLRSIKSIMRLQCQSGSITYPYDCKYDVYSADSFGYLYDTDYEVAYEDVTVSYGGDNFENGGEEHSFLFEHDTNGYVLVGDDGPYLPMSNTGILKGKEVGVQYFKKNGTSFTVLKEIQNTYTKDERYSDQLYGYVVSKKYSYPLYFYEYNCTSGDAANPYYHYVCTAAHDHFYWKLREIDPTKCIALGNNNVLQGITYENPCYGKAGQNISLHTLENFDIYEYKILSQWNYLSQTKEIDYDLNGANPVTTVTDYYYDNTTHLQMTRKETVDSKGNQLSTTYKYPDDVTSKTSLGNSTLTTQEFDAIESLQRADGHRMGELIQVHQNQNGIQKQVSRISYANMANAQTLKEKVFASKKEDPLQERLIYYRYDDFGNPLEVSKPGGPHVVFIYGYQNQYPVAKIENATYDEVSVLFDQTILNDLSTTEDNMRLELNKIRNGLPNAMVTTSTYEPLVGVTSITDPRGITTFYEYDSFNRLHLVKDNDDKIISENKYNYKN